MSTQTKEDRKLLRHWTEKAQSVLLGKKIVEVRYLNDEEMNLMGWRKRPVLFVLDDNTACYLSCDEEGNDGGVLFYNNTKEEGGLPVL